GDGGGLEVGVDDAGQVGVVDGARKGLDELRGLRRRQRFAVQLPRQAAAANVLQCQVGAAILLANFVDLNDTGGLQPRDRLCLRVEASQFLFSRVGAGEDHFQGNQAVQLELSGQVDHPHAALPKNAQDLIASDVRQNCP